MQVGSVRVVQTVVLCVALSLLSVSPYAAEGWQDRVQPVSNPSDKVSLFDIAGSNTVGAKLAPMLVVAFLRQQGFTNIEVSAVAKETRQQITALWQGDHNSFTVDVSIEAQGSSTGFKALASESVDLAASSRPIKDSEALQLSQLGDMRSLDNEHIIAIDGLAVIVNPSNPITALSLGSIQRIFKGATRDWSQVSSKSGEISLYARDQLSGTFDTFQRLVLVDGSLSARAKRYNANSSLAAAVLSDANGIGFVALPSAAAAKALRVSDGVATPLAPSTLTVATEDYPLSRRLYFYTRIQQQRKEVVSEFLQFVHSDEGQAVVNQAGYVAQSLFSVPVESADSRLAGWSRMNLNIRFVDGSSSLDNKSRNDIMRLADY